MVSTVPSNALGRGAVAAVRGAGADCTAVTLHPGRMGLYFLSVGTALRASKNVYHRAGPSFPASRAEAYDLDDLPKGSRLLHIPRTTHALAPPPASEAPP